MKVRTVGLVSIIIFIIAIIFSLPKLNLNMIYSQTRNHGDLDYKNIKYYMEDPDFNFSKLKDYTNRVDLNIVIIDYDYSIIFSSLRNKSISSKLFSASNYSARKNEANFVLLQKNEKNKYNIFYSRPIEINGEKAILSILYDFSYFKTGYIIYCILIALLIIFIILIIIILIRISIAESNETFKKIIDYFDNDIDKFDEDDRKLIMDNNYFEMQKMKSEYNSMFNNYNSRILNDQIKYSEVNSFFLNISIGILFIENNGKISLINKATEKLLNNSRKEILLLKELNQNIKTVLKIANKVLLDRESRKSYITTSEKLILEIETRIIYSKYEPYELIGVFVLLRDVTKIKHMEQLQDEFISNVSHELKTPMTIISGLVQAILNSKKMKEEQLNYCLNQIYEETLNLDELISNLLFLSKIEETKQIEVETFDIVELISHLMASFISVAEEKNLRIILKGTIKKSIFINTNKQSLMIILNNIILNAIKYSPNGNNIIIEINKEDNFICIKIKDKGIGINPKDLPYIFDRFYRVDKSRNSEIAGTGLGLSISKKLIDTLNGEIFVESKISKGSIFSIKIPLDLNNS